MGQLVDGEWTQFEPEAEESGAFQRQESVFRDQIGESFPVDEARYHLYISRACPWAHGAVLTKTLLGLDQITVDVVDPFRADKGWQFSPDKAGCTPDTVNGFDYLYEAYEKSDPDFTGRVTVPLLWDTEANTAVNNESIEIMRMLHRFNTDRTLYPEQARDEIDAVVDDLYSSINNGVYKAGFAGTQDAYDQAVDALFDALDRFNETLADKRFLVADQLTIADLRLFATLVRFDQVYHTHFKCNVKQIRDYPHLHGFLKDLSQLDGVTDTINMDHIKEHYYRTHPGINPKRIIPKGPTILLDEPHNRNELPGDALGLD